MYLAEQKEEKGKKREQKGGDDVSEEKHIKYYMTEHGQIFKFDRTKFISCELDLQNMVWFQNQDFTFIFYFLYLIFIIVILLFNTIFHVQVVVFLTLLVAAIVFSLSHSPY